MRSERRIVSHVAATPTGTVTFLFTDIEGSTRLWETDAAGMRDALARHDEVLRHTIERHDGHIFATNYDDLIAFTLQELRSCIQS